MFVNSLLNSNIAEFSALLDKSESVVKGFGGRRFKCNGLEGDASLNDLVKAFHTKVILKKQTIGLTEGDKNAISQVHSRVMILDNNGNDALKNKNIFTRILTVIRACFGNLFFNRAKMLKELYSLGADNLKKLVTINVDTNLKISYSDDAHNPLDLKALLGTIRLEKLSAVTGQSVSTDRDINGLIGPSYWQWACQSGMKEEDIIQGHKDRLEALKQDFNAIGLPFELKNSLDYDKMFKTNTDIEIQEINKAGLNKFWSDDEVSFDSKMQYPPIDEEQTKRLNGFKEFLFVAQEKLTAQGIPNWVDAGTLLGIYRYGGKQLPQDYDADLCILQCDANKVIEVLKEIARAQPELYEFNDLSSEKPGRFLRMWLRKTGGWVGIESYVVNGDEKSMDMVYGKDKLENVFPLVKTDFYEKKVWIPCQAEKHLHSRWEDLSPISYWSSNLNKFVLNINHPNADSERKKIKDGKVKGEFYIPKNEADMQKALEQLLVMV